MSKQRESEPKVSIDAGQTAVEETEVQIRPEGVDKVAGEKQNFGPKIRGEACTKEGKQKGDTSPQESNDEGGKKPVRNEYTEGVELYGGKTLEGEEEEMVIRGSSDLETRKEPPRSKCHGDQTAQGSDPLGELAAQQQNKQEYARKAKLHDGKSAGSRQEDLSLTQMSEDAAAGSRLTQKATGADQVSDHGAQSPDESRSGAKEVFVVRNYARLSRMRGTENEQDVMRRLIESLKEPVSLGALAGSYGLDYVALDKLADQESESLAAREAAQEVNTLRNIKTFLETARPAIQTAGNVVTVHMRKIPTRLLEVERRRMRLLLRGGNVNRHNYTNPTKPGMYRCGLPGCGGAVLNANKIKQALKPHCRAFRNCPGVQFVFHFALQKGWDMLRIPPIAPGMPPPGCSTPGVGAAGDQTPVSTELLELAREEYRQNAVAGDPRKRGMAKERERILAMRNKKNQKDRDNATAAERRLSDQKLMERIEKEQRQTGVYQLNKGNDGETSILDCGGRGGKQTASTIGSASPHKKASTPTIESDTCLGESEQKMCDLESNLSPRAFQEQMIQFRSEGNPRR